MKNIVFSTFLILTASCSIEQDDKKKSSNAAAEKSISTSIPSLPESSYRSEKPDKDKNSLTFSENYSYKLNEQKYTSTTDSLKKGSPVFSPFMSEGGILKGSFIVISTREIEKTFSGYKVNTITKDTYRLTPLKSQANLYELYSELLTNTDFSRVEIEIDFSQHIDEKSY